MAMKGLNYYLFVRSALTAAQRSYISRIRTRTEYSTEHSAMVLFQFRVSSSRSLPLERSQALTELVAVQRAFNLIRSPFCSSLTSSWTTERGTQTPQRPSGA